MCFIDTTSLVFLIYLLVDQLTGSFERESQVFQVGLELTRSEIITLNSDPLVSTSSVLLKHVPPQPVISLYPSSRYVVLFI